MKAPYVRRGYVGAGREFPRPTTTYKEIYE